jgi:hypothetical protein
MNKIKEIRRNLVKLWRERNKKEAKNKKQIWDFAYMNNLAITEIFNFLQEQEDQKENLTDTNLDHKNYDSKRIITIQNLPFKDPSDIKNTEPIGMCPECGAVLEIEKKENEIIPISEDEFFAMCADSNIATGSMYYYNKELCNRLKEKGYII